MEEACKRIRREQDFAPGKVEVSSEESPSFLGGKSDTLKTPLKSTKKGHSRAPQTLVNNVDVVRQTVSPFLCGEGRQIGNFEHQRPHFEPRGSTPHGPPTLSYKHASATCFSEEKSEKLIVNSE